ncbi:MAG: YlzJ-like family protein [Paenibacillaceae bacterium]
MIMYTIVADELLYAGIEEIQTAVEMWVDGVLMQVEIMPNHEVKVIRLMSPELAPYLNDAYMPGRIIRL